jgi:hypothetical protein
MAQFTTADATRLHMPDMRQYDVPLRGRFVTLRVDRSSSSLGRWAGIRTAERPKMPVNAISDGVNVHVANSSRDGLPLHRSDAAGSLGPKM